MLEELKAADVYLFRAVNSGCSNPVFDAMMPVLTWMGTTEFLVPLAVLLFLFRHRRFKLCALELATGASMAYFLTFVLKDLIGRPRPFKVLEGVNLLAKAGAYSMPSGHSTMAFTAATILGHFFGKKWLFYSLGVLVMFTRVYNGAHYPSDTVAGAVLGLLTGHLIIFAFRKAGLPDRD